MDELIKLWLNYKEMESDAKQARQDIENAIAEGMKLSSSNEGTTTQEHGNYMITANQRMNRKINGDMLRELAIEHNAQNQLGELFRWKPEIKLKEWKASSREVTSVFSPAITTTPGRPSFKIIEIEVK